MPGRWLTTAAWVAFVLVAGAAAYLTLAACDLGPHPLFGLSYCRAQASADPLAHERDRERDLLDRLHQAQLAIAQLPLCLPETPRRRAENIVPTPAPSPVPTATPTPTPTPAPTPTATPTPDDRLVVPRNLSDLNGCWQSVRGDLPMVSDDARQRPIGSVRICYCLDGNGGGTTRYKYQDGGRCAGPLQAQLSEDRLSMSHGRIKCVGSPRVGYVVPADIVCSNKAGEDSASCDTKWHLRIPTTSTDEKYRRVSEEYCN
jgi:hypothetical protein